LIISNSSTLQKDTTVFFVNQIENTINDGIVELTILIDRIYSSAPAKIKKQFHTKDEFSTALICEYIMMN